MADLKNLSEIIRNMDNLVRELEKFTLEGNKKKGGKIKEKIISLQKKAESEINNLKDKR